MNLFQTFNSATIRINPKPKQKYERKLHKVANKLNKLNIEIKFIEKYKGKKKTHNLRSYKEAKHPADLTRTTKNRMKCITEST